MMTIARGSSRGMIGHTSSFRPEPITMEKYQRGVVLLVLLVLILRGRLRLCNDGPSRAWSMERPSA